MAFLERNHQRAGGRRGTAADCGRVAGVTRQGRVSAGDSARGQGHHARAGGQGAEGRIRRGSAVRRLERQFVPTVLCRRSEARHGGLRAAQIGADLLRLRMPGRAAFQGAVARVVAAEQRRVTRRGDAGRRSGRRLRRGPMAVAGPVRLEEFRRPARRRLGRSRRQVGPHRARTSLANATSSTSSKSATTNWRPGSNRSRPTPRCRRNWPLGPTAIWLCRTRGWRRRRNSSSGRSACTWCSGNGSANIRRRH